MERKEFCKMPDKILVVDDEREICDLVALYLQNENYTVFQFYTAKDCLEESLKEGLSTLGWQ